LLKRKSPTGWLALLRLAWYRSAVLAVLLTVIEIAAFNGCEHAEYKIKAIRVHEFGRP
jgi:hypothetical protein